MLTRVVVGLTLLIALSGNLLAEEEIARHLERGRVLKAEGKLAEAIDAFRLVIREWPDDTYHTPAAHFLLIETLIDAKRFEAAGKQIRVFVDSYEGRKELLAKATVLQRKLHDVMDREQVREADEQDLAKQLEALEQRLKAQGLRGEELSKAFQREKKQIELQRRYAVAREHYERVRKLWEEQGVSPEQIRERAEKIEAERARLAAQQAELEVLRERFANDGAALERAVEERRRAFAEEANGPWEERHDEEMHKVRREFLHLAEKLGIPGEEAERLLKAHRKDRDRLEISEEELREREQGLHRRLAGMEKRFEEMAMHMERFAQHLEMRNAELGKTIAVLTDRIEHLQHQVERLRERRGEEHDGD